VVSRLLRVTIIAEDFFKIISGKNGGLNVIQTWETDEMSGVVVFCAHDSKGILERVFNDAFRRAVEGNARLRTGIFFLFPRHDFFSLDAGVFGKTPAEI
jgi:hypothetical protein